MIKPKHSFPILRSFLFLAGLSIATTLNIGLFGVETAQAGCGWLDITCKDSWIRKTGRDVDPTNPNSDTRRILRENDPTSPEFAENQWGNAGGAGYPAAAQWMHANNGGSQGLDEIQKKYLRPHFGDLVDRVVVIYNANLMDEWSAFGKRVDLLNSAAQTYCHRIYVDDPYQPNDSSQLVLLAHELTHSKQCEQLGGEGKFGFHYFREFKRAGQNYKNNKLEKEAFDFENYFAGIALYRDILGRDPEPGTAEGVANRLVNGSSLAQERQIMANSEESRNNLANLYRTILGRDPELGAVDGLVSRLANGSSLAQERQIMANSEESQKRHSRPNCASTYNPLPYRVAGTPAYDGRVGRIAFMNNTSVPVTVNLYHPDAPNQVFGSYSISSGSNSYLGGSNVIIGTDWGIQVNNGNICIVGLVSDGGGRDGQSNFQTWPDRLR